MNKKYIISGIVGCILLSFTTAFSSTIIKPTITDPVFKAVYIGGPASQSALCGSSSATLCMDQVGFYRNEIPGANNNILKWNNGKISIGPLTSSDIPNNIITSTHIFNTTILPGDFDINYPHFRIPTLGEFVRTTGNCGPGRAATGMNAGVMRCVSVDFLTGLALPNCGPMGSGYTLTFTGNQWVCLSNVVNVLGADGGDTNWSGATTGDIRNRNTGNVGVGLTNATEKLTVQDSFMVNGGGGGSTPDLIYCYKTDTWVDKSSYVEDDCILCPSGYTYDWEKKKCTKPISCTVIPANAACGTATGSAYFTAPSTNLCQDGSAPTRTAGANGIWTWTCLGANGGTNASCQSKETPLCGTANGKSYVQGSTIYDAYCTRGSSNLTGAISTTTVGTKSWSCSQYNATGNCSLTVTAPPPVDGYCNTSTTSQIRENKPAVYQQCYAGSPGPIGGTNPRTWSCYGQYGGKNASCSTITPPAAVNAACGTATGSAYFIAPTTNLCQDGSTPARTAGPNGTWTWTCLGANGGTNASCQSKETPACGTASGQSYVQNTTIPTPYCARGTSNIGTISSATAGTKSWSCSQYNATGSCSLTVTAPPPVDGYCNTSTTSQIRENKPAVYQQCYAGSPGPIGGTNPRTWSCYGQYGGKNASCSTMPLTYHRDTGSWGVCNAGYRYRTVTCKDNFNRDTNENNCTAPKPLTYEICGTTGVCGSSNGLYISSSPTTNLCNSGNPSPITTTYSGATPLSWSWYCVSQDGGNSSPECVSYRGNPCKAPRDTNTSYDHGVIITAYSNSSPNCGYSCDPKTLTCNNGTWIGADVATYNKAYCSAKPCSGIDRIDVAYKCGDSISCPAGYFNKIVSNEFFVVCGNTRITECYKASTPIPMTVNSSKCLQYPADVNGSINQWNFLRGTFIEGDSSNPTGRCGGLNSTNWPVVLPYPSVNGSVWCYRSIYSDGTIGTVNCY